MTITLNAPEGAQFLNHLLENLVVEVVQAETRSIEKAHSELIAASSGTKTQKQLNKAGNPYSRRRPNAAYNPGIINAQTGVFRSSWVQENPQAQSDGAGGVVIASSVTNTDPKAEFMAGTDTMVKRPIIERVEAKIEEGRNARLAAACDRAFKKASK